MECAIGTPVARLFCEAQKKAAIRLGRSNCIQPLDRQTNTAPSISIAAANAKDSPTAPQPKRSQAALFIPSQNVQYIMKKIEAVVIFENQGFAPGKKTFRKGRSICPTIAGNTIKRQSLQNIGAKAAVSSTFEKSRSDAAAGVSNTPSRLEIEALKTDPATFPFAAAVKNTEELIVVGRMAKYKKPNRISGRNASPNKASKPKASSGNPR